MAKVKTLKMLKTGQRWMVYAYPEMGGQSFEFTLGQKMSDSTWKMNNCTLPGMTNPYAPEAWWTDNVGLEVTYSMILLCTKS